MTDTTVSAEVWDSIVYRVGAALTIRKLNLDGHGEDAGLGAKALDAVERHRDIIIDVLCYCHNLGVTGRNQEERAAEAVFEELDHDGELDGLDEDGRERMLDLLEAFIQPMRFYHVGDGYETSLRETMESFDRGRGYVAEMEGRLRRLRPRPLPHGAVQGRGAVRLRQVRQDALHAHRRTFQRRGVRRHRRPLAHRL